MVKRICSVVLMFVMLISIQVLAFAEYFYVGGFNENNLPAKKIAISDNYAFVACGEGVEATDKINVYNLGTKELITTLSLNYRVFISFSYAICSLPQSA